MRTRSTPLVLLIMGTLVMGGMLGGEGAAWAQPAEVSFTVKFDATHFTKAEFAYVDTATGKPVQLPIVPGKAQAFPVASLKHKRLTLNIGTREGIRPQRWLVNGARHAGTHSKSFYFKSPRDKASYDITIVTEDKGGPGQATVSFEVKYEQAHVTKAEFHFLEAATGKRVQLPIVPGKRFPFAVQALKHNRVTVKIDTPKEIRPKAWLVNGARHAGGYSKTFTFKSASDPTNYDIQIVTEKK